MELNEWHLFSEIIDKVKRRGIASFEFISMENDHNFTLRDSGNTYQVRGEDSVELMSFLIDEMNFIVEIIDNEMVITRHNPASAQKPPKLLPPFELMQ